MTRCHQRRTIYLAAGLMMCGGWISSAAHGQTYDIVDLGVPSGMENDGVIPYAINTDGTIVGWVGDEATNQGLGFRWTTGTMTSIGTLGGANSFAFSINDSGAVVGTSNPPLLTRRHAFLFQAGVISDLGTLGGFTSAALGVNAAGKIVGYSTTGTVTHAFLYSAGVMTDLGALGSKPNSYARDINDSDEVVGWSGGDSTADRIAFLWDSTNGFTSLGKLPGHTSNPTDAYAINNSSQVVGLAGVESTREGLAFIWQNGTMTALGTLGGNYSHATGLNNFGYVVGESKTAGGQVHAYLWWSGHMIDLNGRIDAGLGWTLTRASGISDIGEITGYGVLNGKTRGFLLTPSGTGTDPNEPTGDPNDLIGDPNDPNIGPVDPNSPTVDPNEPNTPTTDPNHPTTDPNSPTGNPNTPTTDPNNNNPSTGGGCCGAAAPLPPALLLAMFWLGLNRRTDHSGRRRPKT